MKCQLIKYQISRALDDGSELSAGIRRHLSLCPDCAAWHQESQALVSRLRQAAAAVPVPALPDPPPFLQAGILREIRRQREPEERLAASRFSIRESFLPRAGLAAAALAVAGIAVFSLHSKTPDSGSSPPTTLALNPPVNPRHQASPVPPAAEGSKPHGNPLFRAAAGLDQPLRREFALLNEDAQAALRALKTGFFPGGPSAE